MTAAESLRQFVDALERAARSSAVPASARTLTSGSELTSARKVTLHGPNGSQFFVSTVPTP